MINDIKNWIRVSIDLRRNDQPAISIYRESCAWLNERARSQWTHNSLESDQTVTYFIKDPHIAMLFKLTWG